MFIVLVFSSDNIVLLFQLLVNSKIISLDLPVKDVYKKIWCPEGEVCFYLSYTYKMQGNEQLPTGMKAQLVTSLGIAGSFVTFSERLPVILFLCPAVIVTML